MLEAAQASGRIGRSRPGTAGQDQPVPVWVHDRDAAVIPVWIAGGDLGAARGHQAADNARLYLAIEVEHQQIFLGRRGWCFTARIADEFEVPCGIWPPDHQQRMSAFCGATGPEQDLKAQAVDPEPLGRPQVVARPCDTQVACRQRFHR
jgi:hypothetical protein